MNTTKQKVANEHTRKEKRKKINKITVYFVSRCNEKHSTAKAVKCDTITKKCTIEKHNFYWEKKKEKTGTDTQINKQTLNELNTTKQQVANEHTHTQNKKKIKSMYLLFYTEMRNTQLLRQ